jgi:lipoate-protein ligase A
MYHGEFKEPGGKLVMVDFSVIDGLLSDVTVSGDFFLYPEDALGPIVDAIEDSPVEQTVAARAALIAAAIPADVEWLGASPLGLATAIDRALIQGEQE